MRNRLIAAATLIGVTVSAAVLAQPKGGVTPLTALDYAEIQQLYTRYYWVADSGEDNCKAYARLFTPDAEFFLGTTRRARGHEELVAFCLTGIGKTPRHYATNIRIEASPEGARGGSYFLIMAPPESNKPPAIAATGVYVDVLVKTPEGWRFKQRTFTSGLPPASL